MEGCPQFQHEAESKLIRTMKGVHGADRIPGLQETVPQLVTLLMESYGQPMQSVTATVHDIVFENCHDGEGDGAFIHPTLDRCVDQIVGELEKLRRAGLRKGLLSDVSVPPLMYG